MLKALEAVETLALASGETLRLRRAWGSGEDLTLEYSDAGGGAVGARLVRDAAEREALLERLAGPGVEQVGEVVVHLGGSDERLRLLRRYASRGKVVVHRPAKRAVVRVRDEDQWVKVLRRSRLEEVAQSHLRAAERLRGSGLLVPEVTQVDERGAVHLTHVPGTPLHQLLDSEEALPRVREAAEVLCTLHHTLMEDLPHHGAAEELRATEQAVSALERLEPESGKWARAALGLLQGEAANAREAGRGAVTLHRDFHDKQVLLGDARGLVDLDTLAAGDAELDVANLVVHLHLRGSQGRLRDPESTAAAFEDQYQAARGEGLSPRLLELYRRTTAVRLYCVYHLRPSPPFVLERLRSLAGKAG